MVRALAASLVLAVGPALVSCGPEPAAPGCKKGCVDPDTGVTDPGGLPVGDTPVNVDASGPIACADPSLRAVQPFDVRLSAYEVEKKTWFWGGGVAVGDVTGDGYHDVVLPGFWVTLFYRGGPDGFVYDAHYFEGIALEASSGASLADYDADGDLDLFVTRFLARDVLLRNDAGVMVDVTVEAGIADAATRSMASSWADYDGDGDLDLFVGSYGFIDDSGVPHEDFAPADASFLYANDGDGTFTDLSASLPAEVHDGYTLAGGFHDLDADMRPELYVVNDFGEATPNILMWNRGDGVLELDDNEHGLDVQLTAMGLGLGDLNGDEVPDFVMPAWNKISLLESSAELGLWYEAALIRGITYDSELGQKIGWGADMVDVDNDGDLDIPVAFGYLDSNYSAPLLQADAMFIQGEDGTFVDEAAAWGFADLGAGRGYVATDMNNDGWLDIIKRDLYGASRMYLSRCGTESWLRVRLHAPAPNTFGVGARVRAVIGSEKQVRWVHAGGTNQASGGPPEVHFGLGAHETLDRIEVFWPDGGVSVVTDVDGRQILDIRRDL